MTFETSNPVYIQSCQKWLDDLLVDFFREPTIQDVGFWLVNYPLSQLPPRLVAVLKPWLEEHNDLTIKQSRRGNSASELRNLFPLITRMHQDTGLPIEAACKMICDTLDNDDRFDTEVDPQVLRRTYDRAITPHERWSNESIKAIGAFNKSGTPMTDIQKAADRFKKTMEKTKNRT